MTWACICTYNLISCPTVSIKLYVKSVLPRIYALSCSYNNLLLGERGVRRRAHKGWPEENDEN